MCCFVKILSSVSRYLPIIVHMRETWAVLCGTSPEPSKYSEARWLRCSNCASVGWVLRGQRERRREGIGGRERARTVSSRTQSENEKLPPSTSNVQTKYESTFIEKFVVQVIGQPRLQRSDTTCIGLAVDTMLQQRLPMRFCEHHERVADDDAERSGLYETIICWWIIKSSRSIMIILMINKSKI